MNAPTSLLPPHDAQRELLHNEVHARPPARIRLPALLTYVAVFNEGVDREQECALLRRLPGQAALTVDDLHGNFLRLRLPGYTLKWERHTEFTRYSLVQNLPEGSGLGASDPALLESIVTPPDWLRDIPGQTVAAIKLVMLLADLPGIDRAAAVDGDVHPLDPDLAVHHARLHHLALESSPSPRLRHEQQGQQGRHQGDHRQNAESGPETVDHQHQQCQGHR